MITMTDLVQVKGLQKYYDSPDGPVKAVDGVDLTIKKGLTYGLVGESGCGKSTLIRTILCLLKPTAGSIFYKGEDITGYDKKRLRMLRKEMTMVFQDPHMSLNPRMTVYDILSRPLILHRIVQNKKDLTLYIVNLLQTMGLQAEHMVRFPHELSGGQKQRIGVARALAVEPSLIFLDEPTSALDVSVQTKILKLLNQAKKDRDLTYFFISHDINLIRVVSDVMGVMYLGKLVEIGPRDVVHPEPKHPYTVGLFNAVPEPDPDVHIEDVQLMGEVPSPVNPPSGCNFHPRCPHMHDRCKEEDPQLLELENGRRVACHLYAKDRMGKTG